MATTSEKIPELVQEDKQPRSMHMESVARISNLPIVKVAVEVVATVYAKIKENNAITKRTLNSAESIVKNAASTASPLAATFQKPIQKVDNFLCSSLDYVEKNIPALTTDPGQVNYLLNYISETRPVKTILNIPEYSKRKIINTPLISKAQQALSEFKPYFTLKAYPQNLNIYEFITKKINELILSGLRKEVTVENNAESRKETTNDESPRKTTQESQPEEKSLSEPQERPLPEKSEPEEKSLSEPLTPLSEEKPEPEETSRSKAEETTEKVTVDKAV